ncbi:MAG TPA: hypothetical protein VNU24_05785 [Solirubrobacteraceae bacterium]|nr:hypothetical protein [Solirubrobacteraceae bacterium]
MSAGARPTMLARGKDAQLVVTALNLGDANANGAAEPVRIEDTVPAGLSVIAVEGLAGSGHGGEAEPVVCGPVSETPLVCTFAGVLRPYEPIELRIAVSVKRRVAASVQNTVTVSGGGAAAAKTIARSYEVGGERRFGLQENIFAVEEPGGGPDTQAGSHPFQVTSALEFNQGEFSSTAGGRVYPIELPKDIGVLSPPGLVGNPTVFKQCTEQQFLTQPGQISECPESSAIGVAVITFDDPGNQQIFKSVTPVFNLGPSPGEPARFGFYASIIPIFLDVSVRTGSDYGVTVTSHNTSQIPGLLSSVVTLWGVPGDPRHDGQRGWTCLGHGGSCPSGESATPPFLSMPTSCTGPLVASAQVNSWQSPGELLSAPTSEALPALDGCNRLSFDPSISLSPDVRDASTPTGLTVGVHVPQTAGLNPTGLAESTLKDTTVSLPEGVTLDPSGADGLGACPSGSVGFLPAASHGEELAFTPEAQACPDAAKIGTVKIETPLLPDPLEGFAYLAAQNENPFGSLVAMYVVAQDPVSGTLVKLAGEVRLNEASGQIVATFKDTPQLPFEDFELHFFGGERAPLATPPRCGTYTTTGTFAPWSGNEPATSNSTFQITSGPNGTPCPGASLPFSPSLSAGTTSIQAGGFSPFTTTITREDGQQSIQQFQLHMPSGLSGLLTGIELCGEAQANAGTCGPSSLIGETTVSVGLGGNPYSVTGGKVYITGPYEGAPFGVSVAVPAKAGPYDLGTVVVRGTIQVDPITSALTITTNDPSQGYAIPHILDGIPLQIKHVNFTTTRSAFTFNPTNCDPTSITGSVASVEGASSPVSVPFQVTNCAVLAFNPGFAVSTSGKTSRTNGASLNVKLTYPKAPFGSQANIKSVKVDLPRQLPSRLTTLQKACPAKTFEANPAGCPAASIVGHATAITPLIPVSLTGPAYFVSYGGAKFPELVVVLQGYGVTLDLHGETFISSAGITSSTFHTVPDAPVGSFELTLPEGKYSALGANKNLCTVKGGLKMPTLFVAQNGAVIKQTTKIAVTGCAKAKAKKAKKGQKSHKKKR